MNQNKLKGDWSLKPIFEGANVYLCYRNALSGLFGFCGALNKNDIEEYNCDILKYGFRVKYVKK